MLVCLECGPEGYGPKWYNRRRALHSVISVEFSTLLEVFIFIGEVEGLSRLIGFSSLCAFSIWSGSFTRSDKDADCLGFLVLLSVLKDLDFSSFYLIFYEMEVEASVNYHSCLFDNLIFFHSGLHAYSLLVLGIQYLMISLYRNFGYMYASLEAGGGVGLWE